MTFEPGHGRAGLGVESEDPEEEVRRLALERALELPSDEALPLLMQGLGDESWRVRKAAVERLVAAPTGWLATEAVIEALADGENAGRRNAALEALTRCGVRVVPMLLEATHSDDVDVRKLVVDALAGIGSLRSAPRLVEMLDDPDPNVRSAVADALGIVGGESAVQALCDRAVRGDEDPLVRLAALRSIERLEAPLGAAPLATALEDPILRAAALAVLGRSDDSEGERWLLDALGAPARSVREAATVALLRRLGRSEAAEAEALEERIRTRGRETPELAARLLEDLREADLGPSLQLIGFLGVLRDARAVVPLLEAAADEALAETVVAALRGFGDELEEIAARPWPTLPPAARSVACLLLADTRGAVGQRLLLESLDASDPELRAAAARALGARRTPDAVEALVRRLQSGAFEAEPDGDEEGDAIIEALIAIARPGPDTPPPVVEATVVLLSSRLEGADEDLRTAIARVLAGIGRPEDASRFALLLRDPSPRVRRTAVAALAPHARDELCETLRLALADEAPEVRVAAAAVLGSTRDPRAIEDLERLVADEETDVRAAAARAAGAWLQQDSRTPDERARGIALLEHALRDEGRVALGASEALVGLGAEGLRLARNLLDHSDPEITQVAVRCIATQQDPDLLAQLVPLVGHAAWSVRAEVLHSLGIRRVARAVPAIRRRLEVEQDDFVRHAILEALARLEG